MKISELRTIYERTVEARRDLKPGSKLSIREHMRTAFNAWPEVVERDVASVTALECLDWFARITNYSASRFNGMLQGVRSMFTLAMTVSIRPDNPMMLVKACPVRIKPPKLPSHEQFKKVIAYLEASPESRRAVRLVKFLAYSGMRIGEARKLTREDITEHGIRVSDAKNGEDAFVPILPEMAELIKTLPTEGQLFRIKNPRKALSNACLSVGVAPLTNHQLRHLFATRCIECGVDIKTVAHWLRHKDGGALALKRYSHVRPEHSEQMALKVSFMKAAPVKNGQLATPPQNNDRQSRDPLMPILIPPTKPTHRSLRAIREEFEQKRKAEIGLAKLIERQTLR